MGWTKSQIKHLLFEFVGLTLQICWMCNATKGSTNMGLCFTDLSHSALWRTTILQEFPWSVEPCYTQLVGFELSMVNCNLLHMWNLGVLRDVVGSILNVVLKETFVFDGHDIEARLRSATILLRQYAKNNGHTLRLKKLTKNKILWSNKTFPEFQGSGTDCHVVATWLETILQNHLDRYGDLATLLWSGNKAMRLLYSSPNLFLSESEKRTFGVVGRVFLFTYMRLAAEALGRNEMLFKCRPKFHMMVHLIESPRFVNWAKLYATWLDEDWLKKVARTMRFCAVTTAQAWVLERWLLAIPVNIHKSQQAGGRWKKWVPPLDGIGDCMDTPGLEDVVNTNMYIENHVCGRSTY